MDGEEDTETAKETETEGERENMILCRFVHIPVYVFYSLAGMDRRKTLDRRRTLCISSGRPSYIGFSSLRAQT